MSQANIPQNSFERTNYQKGLEFAKAGRHEEAFGMIDSYLSSFPNDCEALNDAGAILHCLGRSQEAVGYLLKAHQFQSDNANIVSNLIEVYLALGMPDEAEKLFDSAEQFGALGPDIINRIADLYVNQGNKSGAVEVLLRSIRLWPNQEIIRYMLTVIKNKRPKIAVFCGADGMTFFNHINVYLNERFEIRVFEGSTQQELNELMQWSDISWFEWCTDLAVAGTNAPKVCKNIVRLHRYEAYTNAPGQVNWQNVDVLITVGNSAVKEALNRAAPAAIQCKTHLTIPNGIDLDKITFSNRQRGKNIAYIGNLRMVKNPAFLLQCMQKLHNLDPGYKLYIAGAFQDGTLEQYVSHMIDALGLQGTVIFDGWQEDINRWLADKNYIISTSVIESQGLGIMEGMAAGLKPVIHNFPGASEIYSQEYLFNTTEQFCEQITGRQYDPSAYRRFIEERYSQKQQLDSVRGVFAQLESQIDSEAELSKSQIYPNNNTFSNPVQMQNFR